MSQKSKLENLKKGLYSKNQKASGQDGGFDLRQKDYSIKEAWGEDVNIDMVKKTKAKISFWGKFLIFSVVFFVLALAVSAYVFLRGENIVSSQNLDIVVSGPVSIAGGEELSFQVSVLNNNNVSLDSVNLRIEYPENTRASSVTGESLPRHTENLGVIKPGEGFQKVFKAVIFGEENDEKTIKLTLEYRVEGSNAIFYKDKNYDLTISSSPISLSILAPDETNSGQEVSIRVRVDSNSLSPIRNTMLSVDYPFGFKLKSSSIEPTSGDSAWYFGDLNPKDRKEITIKGNIEGQDGEVRVFHFSVGSRDARDETKISTIFSSNLHQVSIKKPFISLRSLVNGESGDGFTANMGENLRVDLLWNNNVPTQLTNATVEARLSGPLISNYQITVPTGYYRISDSSIIWNKDRNESMAELSPGESGTLSFNLRVPSFNDLVASGITNPSVSIGSSIRATDPSSNSGNSLVVNENKINIKISSRPIVEASILSSSEGNIRLLLKFKNPINDLSGARVVASIPAYLSWVGNTAPGEEDLRYNPVGGEITWLVGKVRAGSGYSLSSRQVSFDLKVEPGFDLGESPIILKGIQSEASDDFTNAILKFTAPNLTATGL